VLTGVLVCLSFGLLLATSSLVNPELNYSLVFLYYSGLFLSFPLSLLVYVALRFREIIREVRQNAKQVVQLSDEKKQQAVNQQKILQEEVNRQTAELRNTLDDLKSTQSQLIQSEKMASLGELTAGIAHEIQNPLNFVNNFSEVSNELLDEMKTELTNDNKDDAMAIADDIKQNLEKILHHGKRADGIVKGMLQHSRSSSGVKEPSDINVLADEYLRLSYHGLRARDKSFNATMKTDFDDSVGKINIIPQEIGRVILNLINNAFYAVNERQKTEGLGYEPTVTVSTRRLQDRIQISVKDNGSGIPDSIKERYFSLFLQQSQQGRGQVWDYHWLMIS
jgi:signal transduction histidine kinase